MVVVKAAALNTIYINSERSRKNLPHGFPFRMKANSCPWHVSHWWSGHSVSQVPSCTTLPLNQSTPAPSDYVNWSHLPLPLQTQLLCSLFGEPFPPFSVTFISTHPPAQISLVQETSPGGSLKHLSCLQFYMCLYDGLPSTELHGHYGRHLCPLLLTHRPAYERKVPAVAKGRGHLRGEKGYRIWMLKAEKSIILRRHKKMKQLVMKTGSNGRCSLLWWDKW